MAYVEPKIDWIDNDGPVGYDFNRIEGNAKANHESILIEAGIRENDDDTLQANINAEEAARIADVNAEEAARISADTTLQGNINAINTRLGGLDFVNGVAGTWGQQTVVLGTPWVIPKWLYVFLPFPEGTVWFGIRKDESTITETQSPVSFILSDGVNFSFRSNGSSTLTYRKLA